MVLFFSDETPTALRSLVVIQWLCSTLSQGVMEFSFNDNAPAEKKNLQEAFKNRPITSKKRPNKLRQQMKVWAPGCKIPELNVLTISACPRGNHLHVFGVHAQFVHACHVDIFFHSPDWLPYILGCFLGCRRKHELEARPLTLRNYLFLWTGFSLVDAALATLLYLFHDNSWLYFSLLPTFLALFPFAKRFNIEWSARVRAHSSYELTSNPSRVPSVLIPEVEPWRNDV